MSPKEISYTRDQIVQAAFDIVKQAGRSALSARRIAERLGSSTAPVYSYFSSMQQLEQAVEERVHDLLSEYSTRSYTPRADLNIGVGVVLFARDHPRLFTSYHIEGGKSADTEEKISEHMLQLMRKFPLYERISDEDMRSLFSKLKIFSHGLGLLACSKRLPYDDDDYIIYMFWELGEELIDATLQKMDHKEDYTIVHGLKVHNKKIQQLTEWRKKQAQVTQ
jgi:AcrR family transcriptional regulator